jgi:4-hydroxy-4-methyl-2-oxoglutarate aldolase
MRHVVVTDPPRADPGQVGELAGYGAATVHEVIGRTGFLGPLLRPTRLGTRASGSAVTALCSPGDNLMIHAAVEQCHPGDMLVVTTTSPCTDGMLGELLATALLARGARGAVIDAGVRDIAGLHEMGFPVWAAAVSVQGTAKVAAGAVNVPVVIGSQLVSPGDAIVADDDGVVCVPRDQVPAALAASRVRAAAEETTRRALRSGELSLDIYGLRGALERAGVRYVAAEDS